MSSPATSPATSLAALFAIVAALTFSAPASAAITAFTAPATSSGASASASFTESSANGSYIAGFGSFDNHWVFTFDTSHLLTVTVENSFNSASGGGALSFDSMTLTGPGLASLALTPNSPPCVPRAECITRRTGTFAVLAGSYDLRIVGGNPFNGSYRVLASVTAVPEPGSAGLFLLGAMGMALAQRRGVLARPRRG